MIKNRWLFLILVALVALSGCSKSVETYYPLEEGRTWEYQVSGPGGTFKFIMTNLAPYELKGVKVTPQKVEVITDERREFSFGFVSKDAEGIYGFATQESMALEPEIKTDHGYCIKYPIKVGTFWNEKGKTLLEKVPVALTVSIESINEVVTVPAGTFRDCVKIKSTGVAKKNLGYAGIANINVEHYSWYAPGVGAIKEVIKEESDHSMVRSMELYMQLESFKK